MHDEGLIDMLGEKPSGKSGKPRLHYAISGYGSIRLQEESKRLDHAAKIARSIGVLDNEVPTDTQRILLIKNAKVDTNLPRKVTSDHDQAIPGN